MTPEGGSVCRCLNGLAGDPTGSGCHGFECLADDDCGAHEACIGHRCQDPCAGCCGVNANCRVEEHHPVCTCSFGLTGNPLVRCFAIPQPMPVNDPCMPSPCGLNTICQVVKGRPVCSCISDFNGDPQFGCQPECILNSDCALEKACLNRRCVDPCGSASLCGLNALCQVKDHSAACVCPEGFAGDPYTQCITRTYLREYLLTHPNLVHRSRFTFSDSWQKRHVAVQSLAVRTSNSMRRLRNPSCSLRPLSRSLRCLPSALHSGMSGRLRLPVRQGLSGSSLRRSLRRILWSQRRLQRGLSHARVQLPARSHGKSFRALLASGNK